MTAEASADGPPESGPPASIEMRDVTPRQFWMALAVLVLFGLILRGAYHIDHRSAPWFATPVLDEIFYDQAARMLMEGEDLGVFNGFRPLLYPLFLAGAYGVGGRMAIECAVLMQHALGLATAVLVALMGCRLFRNRACGIAGGLLYVLAGPPLFFEGELLITSSYTFLICLTLYAHLRAVEMRSRHAIGAWLLCGALLAFTAQARANILIFAGIYPLYAGWKWWRTREIRELIPLLGLVGVVFMMAGWGAATSSKMGRFQILPAAGGLNLYLGNHRQANGMIPEQPRSVSYGGDIHQDSLAVFAEQEYEEAMRAAGREPSSDPKAVSRYWTKRAMGEIAEAPGRWLRLMGRKAWFLAWNAEIPNNKTYAFVVKEQSPLLKWFPVRWVLLLALLPIGVWAARSRGAHGALCVLGGYLGLYAAGILAFFVCSRYRIPLWPVMAVFAGGGLLFLESLVRHRRWKSLNMAVALMGALAALSLVNWFKVSLPTFARDYFFRSTAYYQRDLYEPALADIRESLRLQPEPPALAHEGNVLYSLGRMEEAREAYLRASGAMPNDPQVLYNLAITLEALGDHAGAYRAYAQGMNTKPHSVRLTLNFVVLQLRYGLNDRAERTLQLLDPAALEDSAMAWVIRAELAHRQGRDREAHQLAQRAFAIDGPDADKIFARLSSRLDPRGLGVVR